MTTPLALACESVPFSNGTEGDAWISAWCEYCAHDHGASDDHESCGDGCNLILHAMLGAPNDEYPWPEAWMPEPDDGDHFLPSRMICGQFSPCTAGSCNGDPGAGARAERVAEVTDYWRTRR